MAHTRKRHLESFFKKQAAFWPVVGIFGMRQVGKTTFIKNHTSCKASYTLDDDDVRSDALASPKAFIGKTEKPVSIDEAQKVPPLFDAIKSSVDKKRVPGQFILSGSSAFSAYSDIRESLTGRIGACHLYPMTFAESSQALFKKIKNDPLKFHLKNSASIISIDEFSAQIQKGGVPIPLFARDNEIRKQYWRGWLDTTLGRDLFRVFGRGYNPDIAARLIEEIGKTLAEGELPTTSHLSITSTKAIKYLNAMIAVFMLKKFRCHASGIGRDIYLPSDSGLAHAIMGFKTSEGSSLNLARIYIQNEVESKLQYSGEVFTREYFKSAKGTVVDWVWNGIPIKITHSVNSLGWEKRALEGAIKKLKSKFGILVTPSDPIGLPESPSKASGVMMVPWSFWS